MQRIAQESPYNKDATLAAQYGTKLEPTEQEGDQQFRGSQTSGEQGMAYSPSHSGWMLSQFLSSEELEVDTEPHCCLPLVYFDFMDEMYFSHTQNRLNKQGSKGILKGVSTKVNH